MFRRVLRDGRRALSDRLSDKHVARLVQGLALAVISAAASASTGSKPPACQSAGGAVSSARQRCCLILHAIGYGRFAPPGLGAGRAGRFGVIPAMRSRLSGGFALAVDLGAGPRRRAPQGVGILAPRLAFRQQGRGHPATRLPRSGTPAHQPSALVGEDGQPIAPQVIGGHPVRMGLRAPGHCQQRRRQPARGR